MPSGPRAVGEAERYMQQLLRALSLGWRDSTRAVKRKKRKDGWVCWSSKRWSGEGSFLPETR